MNGIPRHAIVILLLGLVFLAPVFELFDHSQDLDQGTDLVFVLLCAFVSMGLFILCTRIIGFLFRLLLIATIPLDTFIPFHNRPLEVEIFPPESRALLGSFRI